MAIRSSFLQNRIVILPFFIFITIIIVLSIVLWTNNSFNQNDFEPSIHLKGSDSDHPRLDAYCAKHQYLGAENSDFEGKSNNHFELKKLVITIRHGDRSSIHKIPHAISNPLPQQQQLLLDPDVINFTPHLSSLELHTTGEQPKGEAIGEDITTALDPKLFHHQHPHTSSDFHLQPGQLTSRGFMQHIQLGQLLQSRYSQYFQSLTPRDIYIRSTNYLRTIRSVAAFLITAFPQFRKNNNGESDKLRIIVPWNENDEVMHGIGLRSSSHNSNSADHGDHEVAGQCIRAINYAKKQKQIFIASSDVYNDVKNFFGETAANMAVTEIADALLPSFCHRRPFPCSSSLNKKSSCADDTLLENVMGDSDRYYCNRFSGVNGGQNSTNLSIFPFVHEILQQLSPRETAATPSKLTIFSGHDTVIAPVLSAIGVYKEIHLCRWPQYASRIIFELWQHKDPGNMKLNEEREVAAAPGETNVLKVSSELVKKAAIAYTKKLQVDQTEGIRTDNDLFSPQQLSEIVHLSTEQYFVRVIFNGEDVTQFIPTCQEERKLFALSISNEQFISDKDWIYAMLGDSSGYRYQATKGRFPLCTLNSFTRQIKQMISPHSTINEACQGEKIPLFR